MNQALREIVHDFYWARGRFFYSESRNSKSANSDSDKVIKVFRETDSDRFSKVFSAKTAQSTTTNNPAQLETERQTQTKRNVHLSTNANIL